MPTELRHAFRRLGKSPGFALTAILTLALGIGANTTLFSLIQGALLAPPPFPQSDRLVALRCKQPALSWPVVADFHEYLDWQEQTDLFSDVMVYNGFVTQVLNDETGVRSVITPKVSANFLRTLGLRPAFGRDLTEADCAPGAAPVALVSHTLWKTQLRADPGVIGRPLKLGGKLVTVVGVLPENFVSVLPSERPMDLLVPLDYTRASVGRGGHHLWVYARLKDGISLAQAGRRMDDVARRLQKAHNLTHGIVTLSLQEWSTRAVRPRLLALMGAVALVLLIACVNLANLQLVRITGRTAEISIKMAIGASRWRIARELLAESLLFSLAGGTLGVGLAHGALRLAGGFLQTQFAAFASYEIGPPALLFSGGVTLLALVLSSLIPAWRATAAWDRFMRAIGRSATATQRQRRLNNLFIIAQVGLTLLVLVSAGLLLRSMHRLLTQDRGFATENISIFRISLPPARYGTADGKREQFYTQLLTRLRALPGVTSAALGDGVPLRTGRNGDFSVPGVTWARGQEPVADKFTVSPAFYQTFGISLLKGRDFDPALDRPPAQAGPFSAAVIVNEAFAKKYFGDRDPIGQHVAYDNAKANADPNFTWDTIIGVVRDARMVALDEPPNPAIYNTYQQAPASTYYIAVRSPLDPAVLLPGLREQLHALDPELPLTQLTTMQGVVDGALAQRKLITWTIGGAAGVALALAMLGLYSVIAHTVAQQTREIGVRMAIGARPEMIGRWILAHGLRLVSSGILLGLAGSYGAARLLGALIYDVPAWDPPTYAGVITLLTIVALLACWLPARRAARIDPITALRSE
jgi:putative ABC transport system permease protein